jgi:hypothetical protein
MSLQYVTVLEPQAEACGSLRTLKGVATLEITFQKKYVCLTIIVGATGRRCRVIFPARLPLHLLFISQRERV